MYAFLETFDTPIKRQTQEVELTMIIFSLEVVLKIVSHMDHYTVMSLLRAVPEYSRFAVLVTAHERCPLFFNVGTVIERCYLNESLFKLHSKHPFTPDIANRYPIRLFEFYIGSVNYISNGIYGLLAMSPKQRDSMKLHEYYKRDPVTTSWLMSPGFNNTSFVFVDLSSNYLSACRQFRTRLEQWTGSKWQSGYSTYPPAVGISEQRRLWCTLSAGLGPVFINGLPSPMTFVQPQFVSMRLENVAVIADLVFPHLLDLALVYDNGSVQVPLIEAIVAPKICHFLIHYDGQVPLFRKMGRLTTRMFRWEKKQRPLKRLRTALYPSYSTIRTFELCHIDSIGGYGRGARSRDPGHQKPRAVSDMSFSFLKRFHNILVSGVPWFVLAEMNMVSARYLSLTMTETAGECKEDVIFELPSLKAMEITIKADGLMLAKFKTVHKIDLTVRVLALNPKLGDLRHLFLNDRHVRCLLELSIYSSPTVAQRALSTGGRMYTVTKADKEVMVGMLSQFNPQFPERTLTLAGFPEEV